MHLPDINVWLALSFGSHIHHPSAQTWFDNLPEGSLCFFCRQSQQGLLRLSTNPRVMGKDTLTLKDAWRDYDAMRSDPRVSYHEEPPDLELRWRSLTQANTFSPNVWSDAYLAAFAIEASLELVSFDRGISGYPGLRCTILT
jgi:toxin-antitoxin system PIN domain toxin